MYGFANLLGLFERTDNYIDWLVTIACAYFEVHIDNPIVFVGLGRTAFDIRIDAYGVVIAIVGSKESW